MKNRSRTFTLMLCVLAACPGFSQRNPNPMVNPFMAGLNVPVAYADVSSGNLALYADVTIADIKSILATIKAQPIATFENVFIPLDDIHNKISKAKNNCYMLSWVSPDTQIRQKGFASYQLLDALSTSMLSDKEVYAKMTDFKSSPAYAKLSGHRKLLVDDMILGFERSGVKLDAEKLVRFKKLTGEITYQSSAYSTHMNKFKDALLLDEQGAKGLPDSFKTTYKMSDGKYKIPIINATNETVMNNATSEKTRKAYYMKFHNRAAGKNMAILDKLVKKRDALGKVMGFPTYAAYALKPRMAGNPETVWAFLNDLIARSKAKAKADVKLLEQEKRAELKDGAARLEPWDIEYYKNQILKKQYAVDNEALRDYFPMDQCLGGMFTIYENLLGLKFRKVANPSVWHDEVEAYEVFENETLKGRFYLDLFPRPNKETWFYGVNISAGKATENGYEIPVAMLLGNFTRPTASLPSLLSRRELEILFHEFGHIINMMSYDGEFAFQADTKDDFIESMSQMFENWVWDYDVLRSFAKHYKTGEVLPKALFDNMNDAKNLGSGLSTIHTLRRCLYDMNLYDKYDPASPVPTNKIWQQIDSELDVFPFYVNGTHTQASWIHINTHPTYMYGYLWSEVFAQDMFTEFKKHGLADTKTGVRYRELILSNGIQRNTVEAVEEFLGRPSDNKAYIESLGLEK
jgi:thimet oligopeptidase